MDPHAMEPFGLALLAFEAGDESAEVGILRDDGLFVSVPAAHFFRSVPEAAGLEALALDCCRGPVLDAGAGTGRHALALQQAGVDVTALDLCPAAVEIMRRRGVMDARFGDILEFDGRAYATVLLLGHSIGSVETIAGLDRFLARMREVTTPDGQVLLDTVDVRATDDPVHLAYHDANRRAGRYAGEIRMALEFRGLRAPYAGWLHLDGETLAERGARAGWACEPLAAERGEALYRLSRAVPG